MRQITRKGSKVQLKKATKDFFSAHKSTISELISIASLLMAGQALSAWTLEVYRGSVIPIGTAFKLPLHIFLLCSGIVLGIYGLGSHLSRVRSLQDKNETLTGQVINLRQENEELQGFFEFLPSTFRLIISDFIRAFMKKYEHAFPAGCRLSLYWRVEEGFYGVGRACIISGEDEFRKSLYLESVGSIKLAIVNVGKLNTVRFELDPVAQLVAYKEFAKNKLYLEIAQTQDMSFSPCQVSVLAKTIDNSTAPDNVVVIDCREKISLDEVKLNEALESEEWSELIRMARRLSHYIPNVVAADTLAKKRAGQDL